LVELCIYDARRAQRACLKRHRDPMGSRIQVQSMMHGPTDVSNIKWVFVVAS